jgi:hypothetical protein
VLEANKPGKWVSSESCTGDSAVWWRF